MQSKKLTEICNPKQWKTIAQTEMMDTGYPVYGANGIIGYYNQFNHEKPTVLITCRGATCGTLNISKPFSYINGNAMALDNVIDEIDDKYLYYYLKSRGFRDVISGSAQPQITIQNLAKVIVPYPSIDVQRKIVFMLDKADEIRTKKKLANDKLDEFLKSTFIDMFGISEYGRRSLNDISLSKGEYGSGAKACDYNVGSPRYVRITDINDNGKLNNKPVSPLNETNIDKYVLKYGDILFARTGATVGKTYLYNNNDGWCIYAGYCIRFKLNLEIVNPHYVFAYTQTSEYDTWVKSKQRVVAQPNINAKEYGEELLIPIPPIEEQNKFAQIVEKVEAQKQKNDVIIEQMNNLFNSLSQQAFKGELC